MIPNTPYDSNTIKKALDEIEKGSSIVSAALDYALRNRNTSSFFA